MEITKDNTNNSNELEATLRSLETPTHHLSQITLLKGWLQSPSFQVLRRKQEDEPIGAWIYAQNRLKYVPKAQLDELPGQFSKLYNQAEETEAFDTSRVVILLDEPIEDIIEKKPMKVGGWVCHKPATSTNMNPLLLKD